MINQDTLRRCASDIVEADSEATPDSEVGKASG